MMRIIIYYNQQGMPMRRSAGLLRQTLSSLKALHASPAAPPPTHCSALGTSVQQRCATTAASAPPAARGVFKWLGRAALAAPLAAVGVWILSSSDPGTRATVAVKLPVRFVRDVVCAASIAAGTGAVALALALGPCRLPAHGHSRWAVRAIP